MKRVAVLLVLVVAGCSFAPRQRFAFSDRGTTTAGVEWLDVNQNGRGDFALGYNDAGAVDRVLYDDNEDGHADRVYRLADYAAEQVPHVVLMLDSLPYEILARRYAAGDFRWFNAPVKMVAPFPSLTELCYTEMFRAPPLPGVIDTQFDPRVGTFRNDIWTRVRGTEEPWERRTNYHAGYGETGLTFLDPRAWYAAELRRAYDTIERSPDRVTYVYVASAASMVCRFGKVGAEEVLDGARKLCLRLLYERRGAIKISMLADHGHNLIPTKNILLDDTIRRAGFKVTNKIQSDDDVVISINGLVTNAAFHTRQPTKLAAALLTHPAVELAIYRDGDRTIVRSAQGSAAIETRGNRFRYRPIDTDVLGYADVTERLEKDGEGFATEQAWLAATVDAYWPDAPPRLAAALGRLVVSTPSVLISVRDGFCTGNPGLEKWIKMASTHGGLNQTNSATFVISMTDHLRGPVLPRDVLHTLEPGDGPRVLR